MGFISFINWLEHNSIALMVAVFTLVLVATYWPGRKSSIERNGRIPLEDDR